MSTFIKYKNYRFTESDREILAMASSVIERFEEKGYSMTVRQIYYQFLKNGWMDDWWPPKGGKSSKERANSIESYNKLKKLMSRGRRAGLISWTAIEDITRQMYGTPWVESPEQALANARSKYALDLWRGQPYRPFALVEKDGQLGIIGGICNRLRIDYASCRGYTSESAIWRIGRKCAGYIMKGQTPIAFHLSDHDPSGIDMTDDIRDRLSMFAGTPITVVRLALNLDQIRKFDFPPNAVKKTDARWKKYARKYGEDCWEMDAPSPEFTAGLIEDAVAQLRDEKMWSEALAEEAADKDYLDHLIEQGGNRDE